MRMQFAVGVLGLSLTLFRCGGGVMPDAGSGADSGCISIPSDLPASIAAPSSVHASLELHATGVQEYVCKAVDAGEFSWTFVAPDAQLFPACDPSGAAVGHHFAGPTWQWYADNSEFVSSSAAATKAASPDDPVNDIPWLLLPRVSGSDSGYFSVFTFIQRVQTDGGVAPGSGCGASNLGADASVPYEANYLFYGP